MRYLIVVLIVVLFSCSTATMKQNAKISFPKTELDLGILQYKHPETVSFLVKNDGETPLVIYDVQTSCGCTVPTWNKKPIKPNKTGSIEVSYDSDFPGKFHKTITVFYNGVDSPDTLIISGNVGYPEELKMEN
jgi:hypothetical protein